MEERERCYSVSRTSHISRSNGYIKYLNCFSGRQDLKKGKQSVTIRCSVNLKGDYKLGGQLLIFPIQGQGKYTIDIRK
jgi:hypothetical protein